MNAMYAITIPDSLLTDGVSKVALLHDIPMDDAELHIAAQVASGDYFTMLASVLEEIASGVPELSVEQYRLQSLVGQLLYLQRHYRITKR